MVLNIKDRLLQSRIDLLLDYPFYGNLALHLPLVEMDKGTVAMLKLMRMPPTFCTDYKKIYYNPEFVEQLSKEDLRYILTHEISHIVFLHNIRKGEREPERWNFSTDYAINSILHKEFGFVPKGGLYEEKFNDMTAEAIYNKLPEMNGNKEGYRRYEKGEIVIEIDKDGNIKVNKKDIKLFDTHQMGPKGSKQELDELEKDITIMVSKAYQQAKMAGKLPAGMEIYIGELLEPKLDWRNMLRQFMITSAKSDFNWLPSNRRFIHQDMYMPSITGESLGEVAVIMDVSGSTGGKAQQQFLSEANGLLQQFEMTLNLIACDTKISSHDIYETGDTIKKNYTGLGGTEIKNAFDYLNEKKLNPNVVVVLTDGYTDLDFKSRYPTLWVITKDGIDLDKVPFGMKVKMSE